MIVITSFALFMIRAGKIDQVRPSQGYLDGEIFHVVRQCAMQAQRILIVTNSPPSFFKYLAHRNKEK